MLLPQHAGILATKGSDKQKDESFVIRNTIPAMSEDRVSTVPWEESLTHQSLELEPPPAPSRRLERVSSAWQLLPTLLLMLSLYNLWLAG